MATGGGTADSAELKSVLRENLENRGVLGQLKAQIRAEVFSALDDQSEPKPPLSHENLLINELIRDYLEFNHYNHTSSVLLAESGHPKEALGREFLAKELNLDISTDETAASVPLLYGILAHFMKGPNPSPGSRPKEPAVTYPDHRQDTAGAHTLTEAPPQWNPETVGCHNSHLSYSPAAPEPLTVKGGK